MLNGLQISHFFCRNANIYANVALCFRFILLSLPVKTNPKNFRRNVIWQKEKI